MRRKSATTVSNLQPAQSVAPFDGKLTLDHLAELRFCLGSKTDNVARDFDAALTSFPFMKAVLERAPSKRTSRAKFLESLIVNLTRTERLLARLAKEKSVDSGLINCNLDADGLLAAMRQARRALEGELVDRHLMEPWSPWEINARPAGAISRLAYWLTSVVAYVLIKHDVRITDYTDGDFATAARIVLEASGERHENVVEVVKKTVGWLSDLRSSPTYDANVLTQMFEPYLALSRDVGQGRSH
jgi:hypothetical protein